MQRAGQRDVEQRRADSSPTLGDRLSSRAHRPSRDHGAEAGELSRWHHRACRRSACPTGSSGGSGSRRRRPCRRAGAGWRARRAGRPRPPTTWRSATSLRGVEAVSRRHAACSIVTPSPRCRCRRRRRRRATPWNVDSGLPNCCALRRVLGGEPQRLLTDAELQRRETDVGALAHPLDVGAREYFAAVVGQVGRRAALVSCLDRLVDRVGEEHALRAHERARGRRRGPQGPQSTRRPSSRSHRHAQLPAATPSFARRCRIARAAARRGRSSPTAAGRRGRVPLRDEHQAQFGHAVTTAAVRLGHAQAEEIGVCQVASTSRRREDLRREVGDVALLLGESEVHYATTGRNCGSVRSSSISTSSHSTGHADGDVGGVDVDEVRHQPGAFFEFDHGDEQRVVERRHLRVVVHHVAVDGAAPAGFDRVPLERLALAGTSARVGGAASCSWRSAG